MKHRLKGVQGVVQGPCLALALVATSPTLEPRQGSGLAEDPQRRKERKSDPFSNPIWQYLRDHHNSAPIISGSFTEGRDGWGDNDDLWSR